MTYQEFLNSKIVKAPELGLKEVGEMSEYLFPHQRKICEWAVRGGCRAIFAAFGLGKTLMQLQLCHSLVNQQNDRSLIICPLGVKQEFMRDAKKFFNIDLIYVRNDEEFEAAFELGHQYFITNYERVRDGKLAVGHFTVVSLDEASVLRSFGSKTYQEFLPLFSSVPYKFVATATPSPNRYKELIHYAGFLGIMDTGQALTRFFKRDPKKAGNLQLHPHIQNSDIWEDVVRMRTLNTNQSQKQKEQHTCPLQFDVVERLINRYSNRGDVVLDPFSGLYTVAYCAVKMGRKGYGIELNPTYFADGVGYLKAIEHSLSTATLFDVAEFETQQIEMV